MEKTNHTQLELFSQIKSKGESRAGRTNFFAFHIRGHEKRIIMIILFIVTGIVSFSLGVEKGRSLVRRLPKTAAPRIDLAREQEQPVRPVNKPAPEPQPVRVAEPVGNYTIQVATYQARAHAEREARLLKKKGLSTAVVSKGRFIILCVGNFTDEKTARSMLTELKKQYRDCFIRRL
ncbi:MAG: SPOR domain-containing protein [Candidatus Omnitrophota bacterium]|jgi:hypothetical protein